MTVQAGPRLVLKKVAKKNASVGHVNCDNRRIPHEREGSVRGQESCFEMMEPKNSMKKLLRDVACWVLKKKYKFPHVGKLWRTLQTEAIVCSDRCTCEPQEASSGKIALRGRSLWPQQ